MNDFRRVGWALLIVGTIDVGLMFYCIAKGISYSSSFNIFAIVAGVFLLRGSLKAARIVAWSSALLLSGIGGILVLAPFWVPLDYLRILFKLRPLMLVGMATIVLVGFPFLIWIYRALAQVKYEPSLGAPVRWASKWREPHMGFIAGAFLAATLAGALGLMGRTESGKKAIDNAEHQVGPNYRFFVSSMSMISSEQGTRVDATVKAYNENEIRDVLVAFTE